MRARFSVLRSAIGTLVAFSPLALGAQSKPTIAQFMGPASPLEVTTAKKADRVAWMAYDKGLRNVYTAAAPLFAPVRVTRFLKDDGIDVSDVTLSDDGSVVVFIRGSAPNRYGWVANPPHDPDGARRTIWAAHTATPGVAWEIAEGAAPELSPDGRFVLYVRDGQIYRARTSQAPRVTPIDRGEKPFITAWGTNSNPRWSPDGSKIAFVTNRVNHSYIALYDVATRTVTYVAPSVDFDANPTWSADGKRLLFTRRPGLAFGQQAHEGSGGLGNPAGPAYQGGTGRGGDGRGGGRGGDGGGRGGDGRGGFGGGAGVGGAAGGTNNLALCGRGGGRGASIPGLCSATFAGGYTLSMMIANIADVREAKEVWHNQPNDSLINNIAITHWSGDHIVYPYTPQADDFERYYTLNISDPSARPVQLTTTNGLIEDANSIGFSPDGKTLYYCTNANDIESRHIWAVPVSGGAPRQISSGGIETHPRPLASGKSLAVLYFDAKTPASIGIVPADGGKARVVFPKLGADFPTAAHVVPEVVHTKAADGTDISNTLFLPRDMQPGEKRPAVIFVHGGPIRQMLPGYHYMQFYHWAYAYNQWLQSQGYVVLSINYRGGIGYGRSFRNAPGTNLRGNSEYQDVLAGAKYLQGRADVDPSRIGIWGLSYGGLLTSQALARNSDIFVAGVDMAGVHLYNSTLDTAAVSYRSSAISAIDGWKSPVFLVHGDDDRNVDFAQTVGLVQLLRARNIYHEMIIVPDDLHESMIHSIWIDTWERAGAFLRRFVWEKQKAN
ncbi:MAG TPA: prolyl oligopeptidase family serine peptidase [Gemmatimonadaceae bacterium]|nr:prolyl oligopeptidase family serine peptidase [Gemmatimonadaceae bacterium]